mmetsp:Transcript_68621/g.212229  ORF Transcript_68621/g.212229 Transcript_68621/m.212229 type:complete len:325 (-) Transcript_68621:95-1069(-)
MLSGMIPSEGGRFFAGSSSSSSSPSTLDSSSTCRNVFFTLYGTRAGSAALVPAPPSVGPWPLRLPGAAFLSRQASALPTSAWPPARAAPPADPPASPGPSAAPLPVILAMCESSSWQSMSSSGETVQLSALLSAWQHLRSSSIGMAPRSPAQRWPRRPAQMRESTCSSFGRRVSSRRAASTKSARAEPLQASLCAVGRFRRSRNSAEGSSSVALRAASQAILGRTSVSQPTCAARRDHARLASDCPEKERRRGAMRGSAARKKSATCGGSGARPSGPGPGSSPPGRPKHFAAASAAEASSCGLKESNIQEHLGSSARRAVCMPR